LKVDLDPEHISDPCVSRTLSCPATATFEELHLALQVAFGWASTHSYDFKIKDPNAKSALEFNLLSHNQRRAMQDRAAMDDVMGRNSSTKVPDSGPRQNLIRIIEKNAMGIDKIHETDWAHSQTPEISSKKIKLSKVFENQEYESAGIEYEYDFGDCWTHEITLIGRADATVKFRCLDGEGHGVAEDVGSTRGWWKLKEAYRAENPTQEQKDKRHWFENQATNRDRRGLGNGIERFWDKEAINANLRH